MVLRHIAEQAPLPRPQKQMVDQGLKVLRMADVFLRHLAQKPKKGSIRCLIGCDKMTSFAMSGLFAHRFRGIMSDSFSDNFLM